MAKGRRHQAIRMLGAIFKAEASALATELKAVQDIASILMLRGGKVGVVAIDAGNYASGDQGLHQPTRCAIRSATVRTRQFTVRPTRLSPDRSRPRGVDGTVDCRNPW